MTHEVLSPYTESELKSVEAPLGHDCGIVGLLFTRNGRLEELKVPLMFVNHRGQEGVGVWAKTTEGSRVEWKTPGLIRDHQRDFEGYPDISCAVGHCRYSTSGDPEAWQPFSSEELVLVHNGNLTNAHELMERVSPELFEERPYSDTHVLFEHIRSQPGGTVTEKAAQALPHVQGAYSLIMTDPKSDSMILARDPWGFRPLYYAEVPGMGYIAASEPIAFAQYHVRNSGVREVEAGTALELSPSGVRIFFRDERLDSPDHEEAACIFESIYFAHPGSGVIFGIPIGEFRRRCGKELARKDFERGIIPQVIAPIRQSGTIAAEGYAQSLQWLLLNEGLLSPEEISELGTKSAIYTNQYVDRTFISPGGRKETIKIKFLVDPYIVEGKRVLCVDDSLVRGTTAEGIVAKLYEAGATEVHWRSASPQITHPCFYGIDTPHVKKLIAHGRSLEEIAQLIGATSVDYIPLDKMMTLAKRYTQGRRHFCTACFDGQYPSNAGTVTFNPKEDA